ncbi:hypothetical protein E4T38_02883 [Aureobasidium subglaciale]|nr:hypothetical protein E4T38_02883 [Aureobasidium subglaciale]KAI5227293.1 hypothetical protein E4T40_02680 [Aureobasidium subglaciale]KAI5230502.1 hypothetical protein E4T41_02882 [Aureobasidium subglaciale]KAI5264986.1 hypothetical protein E4T46_02660 [Aureobasidium subglaciale]
MRMVAEILDDTAYAVLSSRIDDVDEIPPATSSPTATKMPVKLSRKIKMPVFKIGSLVKKPLYPLMSVKMDSRSVEAALLVAQEAKEREAAKYTLSGSQLRGRRSNVNYTSSTSIRHSVFIITNMIKRPASKQLGAPVRKSMRNSSTSSTSASDKRIPTADIDTSSILDKKDEASTDVAPVPRSSSKGRASSDDIYKQDPIADDTVTTPKATTTEDASPSIANVNDTNPIDTSTEEPAIPSSSTQDLESTATPDTGVTQISTPRTAGSPYTFLHNVTRSADGTIQSTEVDRSH